MQNENETNTNRDTTVAVLGVGVMGGPIARNLLAAGFDVRVWNRSPERARALADEGAVFAATPGDAVGEAHVVLTSLYDGTVVREVIDQAADHLKPGSVWADMSTLGINDVALLTDFAGEHGITFVDAPVQGARPLAEQGQLLIYAAGPASAQEKLEPVFAVVGRRTDWLATTPGSTAATATKLVVNAWVFALTTAAAEAVALARGLGADPEAFRAAIAGGPLDNPWAQLKSAAIIAGNFAPMFPVNAAAKDVGLILEAAEVAGVKLDVSAAVRDRFARAVAAGHGEKDMAATYLASSPA